MHCEEARDALLARLDSSTGTSPALGAHLDSCPPCRELDNDLLAMGAQAQVWHDVEPPPWNPAPALAFARGPYPAGTAPWRDLLRQWFPVLASSAALLLAAGVYLDHGRAPSAPAPAAARSPMDVAPAAQTVLAVSRRERQQEMEALTALLKAEMDRRSLETEQSLKYIISHQIQSQREIDTMRGRLLQTETSPAEQL